MLDKYDNLGKFIFGQLRLFNFSKVIVIIELRADEIFRKVKEYI